MSLEMSCPSDRMNMRRQACGFDHCSESDFRILEQIPQSCTLNPLQLSGRHACKKTPAQRMQHGSGVGREILQQRTLTMESFVQAISSHDQRDEQITDMFHNKAFTDDNPENAADTAG